MYQIDKWFTYFTEGNLLKKIQIRHSHKIWKCVSENLWKWNKVLVPVSQLVLPVGVTGLTVKGKTPAPEPRSIIMGRSRPGSESVMKTHRVMVVVVFCFFYRTQFTASHTNTEDGISAAGMHMNFTSFVGGVGRFGQPAKKLSHLIYYKEKLSTAGKLQHHETCILIGRMLTFGHHDWPKSNVTLLKQASRSGCNAKFPERQNITTACLSKV